MKKCPHCVELIKAEVAVCRYCQNPFNPSSTKNPAPPTYLQRHLPPAASNPPSCGNFLNRTPRQRPTRDGAAAARRGSSARRRSITYSFSLNLPFSVINSSLFMTAGNPSLSRGRARRHRHSRYGQRFRLRRPQRGRRVWLVMPSRVMNTMEIGFASQP